MQPISVETIADSYKIEFADLAELPLRAERVDLRRGRCFVVTDATVGPLYLHTVQVALRESGWEPFAITIPAGEASKSHEQLSRLYDIAIDQGVDRQTPVFALGGGVVGDLAGYFAATVLRGVPLVHIPTTLVAQVDSAIGGKTGINHTRGKNLVGAFYQPRMVFCDVSTLASLPEREWNAGLAEVVKHALIEGPEMIQYLDEDWTGIASREHESVRHMVPSSARVKAAIVSRDEREVGIRAFLNLGHTVGHAIENALGYGRVLHGEAVAIGLHIALALSQVRFSQSDFSRAWSLVNRLQIPDVGEIPFTDIGRGMGTDKKNLAGVRRFVLLEEPGRPCVVDDVDTSEIEAAWDRFINNDRRVN